MILSSSSFPFYIVLQQHNQNKTLYMYSHLETASLCTKNYYKICFCSSSCFGGRERTDREGWGGGGGSGGGGGGGGDCEEEGGGGG